MKTLAYTCLIGMIIISLGIIIPILFILQFTWPNAKFRLLFTHIATFGDMLTLQTLQQYLYIFTP